MAACLISTLSAQIDTGTITGRVTDPSGAAIPGVQVSLVQNSFYTLAKAIDDCDTDYGTCSGVAPVTNRNLNKGRA